MLWTVMEYVFNSLFVGISGQQLLLFLEWSALNRVCYFGCESVVPLLIGAGANVNLVDRDGVSL